MNLRKFAVGDRFEVLVLTRSDDATDPNEPAFDFYSALGEKEEKALRHRIMKHAQAGPLTNIEHSRLLDDGIFEFKTTFGDRLIWLYDGKGQTVLTNGLRKGDDIKTAIKVAKQMRGEWYEWKESNPQL
jgi:hypothetical protein